MTNSNAAPRVIVGIPTYNNSDTIRATLQMVCDQTRQPDRIVICDNSSDETAEICMRYGTNSDIPIDVLHQTGDGVAAAYNQIWNHIRGKYDYFVTIQTNLTVDIDWLEQHLAIHRDHPEIGIVTCNQEGIRREVQPDERFYYTGRNVSYKQGVLESIDGWDENFLRGEDWDMHIRFAGAGVRSYRASKCAHGWIREKKEIDPYMTFSKSLRRPTSISFLAKYGFWYIRFHPTHVLHDFLSLGGVTFGVLSLGLLLIGPRFAVMTSIGMVFITITYVLGQLLLRGPVDGSYIFRPISKQFLTGIGICVAILRIRRIESWNLSGFDPSVTPSYGLP